MVQVWGSGLRGGRATRASDRRLDVGVVGANAGGLFLSPKSSPWPRKEKFPALGWAGLGGNGPPLPAVKQGWQRLVYLFLTCFLFSFFFLNFIFNLPFASSCLMISGRLVFFVSPYSHWTTANGSKSKAWDQFVGGAHPLYRGSVIVACSESTPDTDKPPLDC